MIFFFFKQATYKINQSFIEQKDAKFTSADKNLSMLMQLNCFSTRVKMAWMECA